MSRTSNIVMILVALVAALLLFSFYKTNPKDDAGTVATSTPTTAPQVGTYTNDTYGVSFQYPESYQLQERDLGSSERGHVAITLIDKQALASVPENGEGPPSITIDFFQNDQDKLPVDTWIKNTSASNFKLSTDNSLASSTIAGVPAYHYTWDGLYRGESTVFAQRGNIVMASVTYMNAKDQIRSDFESILSSIQLH